MTPRDGVPLGTIAVLKLGYSNLMLLAAQNVTIAYISKTHMQPLGGKQMQR